MTNDAAAPPATDDDGFGEPTRISEAAALRALAHPLRQRLFEQLVLFGPLTATQLAERVDDSPSNCSWHLRKLAEHGFVEEDPAGGSGRRRPWRAAVRALRWGDREEDGTPGGDAESRAAGEHLARMVLEREVGRLHEAWTRLVGDDEVWRDAATMTQSVLWLTAAELQEVNDQVRDLLLRHRDRHDHAERRPAGARLCAMVAWGVPTYDLAQPVPAADVPPEVR